MDTSTLKLPSAVSPLLMSLAGLALVLVHFVRFGIVHEADEGTEAHLFQLLMVAQVPIVAFFAIKWLPQTPGPALLVLVMQFLTALVAFAAVFFLTA